MCTLCGRHCLHDTHTVHCLHILVVCTQDHFEFRQLQILYNTIFSREEIFAKSEFEIFSREDNFANMLFTRKYLPAKISSRENIFQRKILLAKIFSRENIFPRIVSVPQICRLVGPGYAVYRGPYLIRLCATVGPSSCSITHWTLVSFVLLASLWYFS